MLLAALGALPDSSPFGNLAPYSKPPLPSAHSAKSLESLVEALGGNQSDGFGSGVTNAKFGSLTPKPHSGATIAALLNPSAPPSPFAGLTDYFGSVADPQTNALAAFGVGVLPVEKPGYSAFDNLINPPAAGFGFGLGTAFRPTLPVEPPIYAPPLVKRRSYFAFHYQLDVHRSVIVRNAWRIQPKTGQDRGFFDSSIWEKSQLTDPEKLKRLITNGVKNTSAVCVLAGSETYLRRWVRYEIARAIIDKRGLLTVHINDIPHIRTKTVEPRGPNPLAYMGVSIEADGRSFLYELNWRVAGHGGIEWIWKRYDDHRQVVDFPRWMQKPQPGYIQPLNFDAEEYDYTAGDGHKNIGSWIDAAAQMRG